jgi:hypothetical protein
LAKGERVKFAEFYPKLPQLPNAACREIDNPDLFYPNTDEEERKSLEVIRPMCDGCIERKECLDYALEEQIPYGIWAGFTWTERKKMIDPPKRRAPYGTRASNIRRLFSSGVQPKEIALSMNIELAYVNQVLKIDKAKLEGEIQSALIEEKLGEGSPSSSGFPQ